MAGGPGWKSPFFLGIGGGFQPVPPPPLLAWTLGNLWQISVICAKNGLYGLQRNGNGALGSSDVTSLNPFAVTQGSTLFTSFWIKAGVNADGQIGFGFSFYNAANALISSQFIKTNSFPSDWLQVVGNITVPNFAVTAVPVVRSFNHLNGFWCVDSVFAVTSGGNFTLSALRHYYSERESFR